MTAVVPNQGTIFTSPQSGNMVGLVLMGMVTSHTQIRIVLSSITYKCQMPEERSELSPVRGQWNYNLVNYDFIGLRIKNEHVGIPFLRLVLLFHFCIFISPDPIFTTQPRQVDSHGGAMVWRLKPFQWREWFPQQGDYALSLADPNRNMLSLRLLVTPLILSSCFETSRQKFNSAI